MIHSLGRLASLRSARINRAELKSQIELSLCLFMEPQLTSLKVVSSLSLKKETDTDYILIYLTLIVFRDE